MKRRFTKMHGCGNDYVYFDCMEQEFPEPEKNAVWISDRHRGVGGDGIILICPSEVADAKMRIFNIDGSEGRMCGNGIRCVGKFLYDKGIVHKTELAVETLSGVKRLSLQVEDGAVASVTVDMGPAELVPEKIPVHLPGERAVGAPLAVDGETYAVTCVSMGNPHCVIFCGDPDAVELEKLGPRFEYHPAFPERVNTEFVSVENDRTLHMRVWERGSGETMACGTGACASVAAAVLNGHCPKDKDVTVRLRGGDLSIRYTDRTVWMTGEAKIAFEGEIEL